MTHTGEVASSIQLTEVVEEVFAITEGETEVAGVVDAAVAEVLATLTTDGTAGLTINKPAAIPEHHRQKTSTNYYPRSGLQSLTTSTHRAEDKTTLLYYTHNNCYHRQFHY